MLPSLSKLDIGANGTDNQPKSTMEVPKHLKVFMENLTRDTKVFAEQMWRTGNGRTILLQLFFMAKGLVSSTMNSDAVKKLMERAVRGADLGPGNGGGTHITAIVQALYAFWEERTGEASTE